MVDSRERITAAMEHRALDRIAMCETDYWPETIERWQGEGFPAGADPIDYFGLDRLNSFRPISDTLFEHEVYEENDRYIIDRSPYGSTVKYAREATTSTGFQELDFAVKGIEDWRRVKDRLVVSEKRLRSFLGQERGAYSVCVITDHYWLSFRMLGLENLCCMLVGAADELGEIYRDWTRYSIGMLDLCVAQGMEFDALWFYSDLAYCNGPLFSPALFDAIVAPYYREFRRWCNENGKKMILHSDGNVSKLLEAIVGLGFDCIQPLEARAGNDVRLYKQKYGDRLCFMGNIDADVLAGGDRGRIEDEIAEKIGVAKEQGGYIYHIDHSVPPTISFDSYCYGIELVKKYGAY